MRRKRSMTTRLASRLAAGAVSLAAAAMLAVTGTGSASAAGGYATDTVGVGPEQTGFQQAFAYPFHDQAPAGANDWSCRPSAAHPRPVVLVHGTWEGAYSTWARLSPALKRAGFCVFAQNYGRSDPLSGGGVLSVVPGLYGTGRVEDSAKQLGVFVDRVLAATGATQVDAVGHSQGGVVIRQYMRFGGGSHPADPAKNKIAHVVTFGATNHGTTVDGIGALAATLRDAGVDIGPVTDILAGVSGEEQLVGSPFIRRLNAGGDTDPGVDYTAIATRFDQLSTPYTATFLTAGPGATVHNVTVQDGCPFDFSDHSDLPFDPRAISITLRALGVKTPLVCAFHPWNQDFGSTG